MGWYTIHLMGYPGSKWQSVAEKDTTKGLDNETGRLIFVAWRLWDGVPFDVFAFTETNRIGWRAGRWSLLREVASFSALGRTNTRKGWCFEVWKSLGRRAHSAITATKVQRKSKFRKSQISKQNSRNKTGFEGVKRGKDKDSGLDLNLVDITASPSSPKENGLSLGFYQAIFILSFFG